MSVTLATVADALIEFILSLLRDPDAAKQFDTDPQAALASRGLQHVNAQDVCAVAPIIAERHDVVHVVPQTRVVTVHDHSDPVVREVHNVVNNLSWVDDRDTLVDQSTNQNIWAQGDVTQTFDQKAVVASGDNSISAGAGVDIDQTQDDSTHITAGQDANVGNTTTTTTTDDSGNTATVAPTTTDDSVTTNNSDSFNDSSTTTTEDHSHDSSTTSSDSTATDTTSNTVDHSQDSAVVQYNDATTDTTADSSYDSSESTMPADATADDGL